MLQICQKHKDAIVTFDGYHCPICEEIDRLKTELKDYEDAEEEPKPKK